MLQQINNEVVCKLLNKAISHELAGVVRYVHYSIMVTGVSRLSLVNFFKTQATESLTHAQLAGDILTGLGGHPLMTVHHIEESNDHSVESIIQESINHEQEASKQYIDILYQVKDKSIYLEDYARRMISNEEANTLEMRKLLRHFKL